MDERERAEAEIERRSRVMHEAARFSRWGKPENDEEPPPEGEGSVEIVRSRQTRDGGELAPPAD